MSKRLIFTLIIACLVFIFPAGVAGQVEDLFMIDDDFFGDVDSDITFQSLTLYWSADSYVPFGYKGRALPTNGSTVTVSADLKITGENPANLKYSWFVDGFFQEAKSGYDQNSFQFKVQKTANSQHTVLLKVFNESRSFLEEKSIDIPITSPEIVIYKKQNPKINISYSASSEIFQVAAEKESSFIALPYFFNIDDMADLEFTWTFANKAIKEASLLANIFGMKIVNKEVGGILEEILKVNATNTKQSSQADKKTIKINIY